MGRGRVDVLVGVRPSVFKENNWQDVGMTRADVPGDHGNESTIQ